ncbi:Qat anti-phage system TatD family nuclease QatD [Desulfovibrio intestinalis]|uniref:TatD DNase family protein n=1 Tax=Desulfovibrio intestinalis TaxID=58621 RepID=A0A7W8C2H2_9BACT|nr:TatD DNase family protein [Desulfovibrio intestinalis]
MNERDSQKSYWVDFHCHLDLYQGHAELIAECDREKVSTLAVTTTPKAWARNCELAAHATHVRVALGLHPQLVAERANEIALFEQYLAGARYVGEIGLDAGPRFYRSLPDQERIFERILRACAEQGGKILSVHSTRAVGKVLTYIERVLPPNKGRVVLHWFTGSIAEARRAAAWGCYFSINKEMLNSPKHSQLIAKLPGDRLLTETDGPFVLVQGKPIRPREITTTVSQLAKLRETTEDEMRKAILGNLNTLLTNDIDRSRSEVANI